MEKLPISTDVFLPMIQSLSPLECDKNSERRGESRCAKPRNEGGLGDILIILHAIVV